MVLAKKLLGTRMSSTQLGSSNYRFCCSYLVRHAVVIELQRSPAIKKRDGLVLARFALMNTSFNISGGLSDGYPQCGWRQYKVTKKPNDVCLPRPQLYQAVFLSLLEDVLALKPKTWSSAVTWNRCSSRPMAHRVRSKGGKCC